jgi:hypothetical protein
VSVDVAKKGLKRGANLFSRSKELMHRRWLKPLLDCQDRLVNFPSVAHPEG